MTDPRSPGEAIRAAAERLVRQREAIHAESERLAREKRETEQAEGGAVPDSTSR